MSELEVALRQFEATESNLTKLELLWAKFEGLIGSGPALQSLPAIDGFKVDDHLHDFDEAGQMRLDALEVGEIAVEEYRSSRREFR